MGEQAQAAKKSKNQWVNFWASTAAKKKSGPDGETMPKKGNIISPDMHVLKPGEVRRSDNKHEVKKEAKEAEKEVEKMMDMNLTAQQRAARAKAFKEGEDRLHKIAAEDRHGQAKQWAMG